ncbi:MAG: SpoIIE family protein phosphatase [bacterium]|nr:SpoIIE family protein phosphatase [bacterium]
MTEIDFIRLRELTAYQMFFTALPLAFGILHLILYLFFKKAKENFYFAIFLFFYSLSIFFDYQDSFSREHALTYMTLHRAVQPFFFLFSLRFVYSIFYSKLPKRFWLFALILVPPSLWAVYRPGDDGYIYLRVVILLLTLEIFRAAIAAIRKKYDGAWLVALGFFIYYAFGIFDSLMDLVPGMDVPFKNMENPYAFGTVGFLITMSVYLARRYARSHEQVADNARKTHELEEARRLQLSMLPQCLNDFPGLDICFHMTPATEVGGDYYDYRFDEDGSLVLAVGDATGHGMKAGIMVASVKSLFRTIGTNPDIPAFFKQCSTTIKAMNMGNMFMALTLIRLKDNKLTASSAGMPPILVFRGKQRRVEEILIKGPPLGAFPGFAYRREETVLIPGDTVLLMSDGFPEQFNEKDEMMGYAGIKKIFESIVGRAQTADEVIASLCAEAGKWRNGRTQDDDMTFVAMKFSGSAKP